MSDIFTVDEHGHLANINQWNEQWVIKICEEENLIYSPELSLACRYVREFHAKFNLEPTIFLISKYVHLNNEQIERPGVWLSCLFPQDTLRQLAKASGLSLPASCLKDFDATKKL